MTSFDFESIIAGYILFQFILQLVSKSFFMEFFPMAFFNF